MAPTRTGPWKNPRWNSLKGPDSDVLRSIFQDLQEWLAHPTFETGLELGTGPGGVNVGTGVKTDAPTVTIDPDYLGDLSDVPDDGATPGATAGLTISAGIRSVFLAWTASTAVDVENGWGTYRVQLSTNSGFSAIVVDKIIGATFTTITGLVTGTTYYARVAAVDAFGNQGSYSSTVSTAPSGVANVDLASGAVTADKIQANTITASEIAADAISASELSAVALGVGKYIRSQSYSAGSSGWSINAAGDAEFNDVTVRGEFSAGNSNGTIDAYADSTFGGVIDLTDQGSYRWQQRAVQSGSLHQLAFVGMSGGTVGMSIAYNSSTGEGGFAVTTSGDQVLTSTSGDVSISAHPTSGKVTITGNDIEFVNDSGIIVHSSNGNRWLLAVSNAGVVQTAAL